MSNGADRTDNECAPATVTAVVVSYHSGPLLKYCLAALLAELPVGELVVVDNGNAPAEAALLDALAATEPRLRLVRPGGNLGFAAACNRAAAEATGAWLAFVNPDLVVSPGALAKVVAALATRPDAWLCGARLLDPDGREQRGGRRDVLTPWRSVVEATGLWRLFPRHPHFSRFNLHTSPPPAGIVEVPTISGAFMVLPAAAWRRLGGMDERLFLHVEDIDLCLRVLKAGARVLYCADASVIHRQGSSDATRLFVGWHKTRGLVRYFFKHFRGPYPAWSLALIAVLLWLRFAAVALVGLPADTVRIGRRWLARTTGADPTPAAAPLPPTCATSATGISMARPPASLQRKAKSTSSK